MYKRKPISKFKVYVIVMLTFIVSLLIAANVRETAHAKAKFDIAVSDHSTYL